MERKGWFTYVEYDTRESRDIDLYVNTVKTPLSCMETSYLFPENENANSNCTLAGFTHTHAHTYV